ncbi:RsbRD N-terminal domain-containing protein [bacterium]|nr:RsbRD N-terminal domain-containing protein [bacterium]
MLIEILREKRDNLIKGWQGAVRETYPKGNRIKFTQRPQEFNDPIGHLLNRDLPVLVDLLLDGDMDKPELQAHLEPLCRLRSVQDFTPAGAMGFVYAMKKLVRESLSESELNEPGLLAELLAFESRIDRLAMYAFDLYVSCREELFELRANEARRRSELIVQHFAEHGKEAFTERVDPPEGEKPAVTNGHEGGEA